ncbi:MAG TPA: Sec-independent protein translocase protein TatB [Paenalcaligenes hominis]|uniref:Sec-independent protein translocase protein TatB n=1 Tax=Paenalcaligenes hominis TaxID=643674 RepID=A0A9D2VIC1_9BURK|nr:Sec-independent protein translocase protein TatB [Paenalcaligenes hominis]NJB65238.1 sec-independent protein translocase protein TatB [Paenalcaligenes hominis]GGE72030.1 Sec-independent protein translocase protein TatB [Paenalcaligenes hominis]HJH25126.1 Sec-independent protein translocase protein TatB [Paenalcaligenes hominis]
MFDISFSELLLIGVVALVVLGPERLPRVARTVGHMFGRAQRYMNEVKTDIQREIDLDEISSIKKQMEDASSSIKQSVNQFGNQIKDPLEEARKAVNELEHDTETMAKSLADSTKDTSQPAASDNSADGKKE